MYIGSGPNFQQVINERPEVGEHGIIHSFFQVFWLLSTFLGLFLCILFCLPLLFIWRWLVCCIGVGSERKLLLGDSTKGRWKYSARWWILSASMSIPFILVKTNKVSLGNTWLSLCDIQSFGGKPGDQVWPNSMSHPLATVTAEGRICYP